MEFIKLFKEKREKRCSKRPTLKLIVGSDSGWSRDQIQRTESEHNWPTIMNLFDNLEGVVGCVSEMLRDALLTYWQYERKRHIASCYYRFLHGDR